MTANVLDGLVLASLSFTARVYRLASIWCREHKNRPPYNASEVSRWAKREFGPVLTRQQWELVGREVVDEIRRQLRIRRIRAQRREGIDPLTLPLGDERLGLMLKRRLGHPWHHGSTQPSYFDGGLYSGLLVGLASTDLETKRIRQPNVLVYRRGSGEIHTRYVPWNITTIDDAFLWLIPPDAVEFLRMPDMRVQHVEEEQAVRLITPWGEKTLPWRGLSSG